MLAEKTISNIQRKQNIQRHRELNSIFDYCVSLPPRQTTAQKKSDSVYRTCRSRMSFLAKARPHSLLVVNLPPTLKKDHRQQQHNNGQGKVTFPVDTRRAGGGEEAAREGRSKITGEGEL